MGKSHVVTHNYIGQQLDNRIKEQNLADFTNNSNWLTRNQSKIL